MNRIISVIIEKTEVRMAISLKKSFSSAIETRKYPAPSKNIFNKNSNKIYLGYGFKNMDYLIKSFITV